MASNYECFRNDLIARLSEIIQGDQLATVMATVDSVSQAYDVAVKTKDLIVADGIPPAVRYYLASKQLENLSDKTLKGYSDQLKRFFRMVKKPIQDISANDIRCYLAEYKIAGKTSDRTIDQYRRILSSFFNWLVANEYILRNPCGPISAIKYQANERKPLTGYDLELLRASCVEPREKAMIDFLFSTGCRVSECCAVKKSDICWSDRSVVIRHGKGDKRRVVFFNAEAEVSLRRYLMTRNDDNDTLFCRTRHGAGPMSTRSVEILLNKIRNRAGVSAACSPHILRHTFATAGLRAGMPLERLQALMGHSKPETTLIYAQIDRTDLQRAHQAAFT